MLVSLIKLEFQLTPRNVQFLRFFGCVAKIPITLDLVKNRVMGIFATQPKKTYSDESCLKSEYALCLCLWLFKNIIKFEDKQLIFPSKIT